MYPYEKRLDPSANIFHVRFEQCQYNAVSGWVTYEELSQMKSTEEIAEFCNDCNICCWLPEGTALDLGEKGGELDWSKVVVDKDYWLEIGNLCVHCEIPDNTKKQELIQLGMPMGE
tara:strand:- start:14 stop:361 length:348 start_codon:yes stop_codon:yes gene_type:complete